MQESEYLQCEKTVHFMYDRNMSACKFRKNVQVENLLFINHFYVYFIFFLILWRW